MASENLHDCTKTYTRAQTENHKQQYKQITWQNADFFGALNTLDALAALKLSSSETEESNAFPLWGKYSIYPVITTLYCSIMGKYQIRLFHLEDCCALQTALEIN